MIHFADKKIKLWIDNIINTITQIADLRFQKKAWIEGKSYFSISFTDFAPYIDIWRNFR